MSRQAMLHVDRPSQEVLGAWVNGVEVPEGFYGAAGPQRQGAEEALALRTWEESLLALAHTSGGPTSWQVIDCGPDETAQQVFRRATADPLRSLHEMYLPFSSGQLMEHFASVGGGETTGAKLRYYAESADRTAKHAVSRVQGAAHNLSVCRQLEHQIEKDERFWIVAALMSVVRHEDKLARLRRLLEICLGDEPPLDGVHTWEQALGNEPKSVQLFFEVSLPAPVKYKQWLSKHREQRGLTPFVRASAATHPNNLEGATKADAMLVSAATGFAVVFEAKVYSDAASHTTYDAARNQIARNIDVLLDPNPQLQDPLNRRRPERSCFVLLTPDLFKRDPTSRLYGTLMQQYMEDTTLLSKHLPHRDPAALTTVPSRLGWASWEQLNAGFPGSCPWLPAERPADCGCDRCKSVT